MVPIRDQGVTSSAGDGRPAPSAGYLSVEGKRIFLMAPLHHHFELKGWAEVTVVVRFWLIAGLFVAVGVGLFYLEWVSQ